MNPTNPFQKGGNEEIQLQIAADRFLGRNAQSVLDENCIFSEAPSSNGTISVKHNSSSKVEMINFDDLMRECQKMVTDEGAIHLAEGYFSNNSSSGISSINASPAESETFFYAPPSTPAEVDMGFNNLTENDIFNGMLTIQPILTQIAIQTDTIQEENQIQPPPIPNVEFNFEEFLDIVKSAILPITNENPVNGRQFNESNSNEVIDIAKALEEAAFAPLPSISSTPADFIFPHPIPPRIRSNTFPLSQFSINSSEIDSNVTAARNILSKIKLLAINEDVNEIAKGNQYGLASVKQKISTISVNYGLNLGDESRQWGNSRYVKALFKKYDRDSYLKQPNEQGSSMVPKKQGLRKTEASADGAFLLLAILLLRHYFMYGTNEGKRRAGINYAEDFDNLIPPSKMANGSNKHETRTYSFITRARILGRIVIACGHPAIILVLVCLATHLNIQLVELLDQIPIEQFCHWVATGRVSSSRLHVRPQFISNRVAANQGSQLESDLLSAHRQILLPLLACASMRFPSKIKMLDGRIECNEKTCVAALVEHSSQKGYSDFLNGKIRNDQYEKGIVRIGKMTKKRSIWQSNNNFNESEPSSSKRQKFEKFEDEGKSQYTIEKALRTFNAFNFMEYAGMSDHFLVPPPYLRNQVLDMTTD